MLQQLGSKEYEAKCFVALSRRQRGTAKDISEISDVPRTRVYDAIRVLEKRGLVEVQHSNPQQFRAVPIEEAVELLREEYDSRASELTQVLKSLDPVDAERDEPITHEVWSISSPATIENRTKELVTGAEEEIVFVIGRDEAFTDDIAHQLEEAKDAGITVVVGVVSDEMRGEIQSALPDVEVFTSGLEWLESEALDASDTTEISRLLLVDRNAILVSSVHGSLGDGETESAVFGRGFDNGLVVIARRMMSTGLPLSNDSRRES